MASIRKVKGGVCAPKQFRANSVSAGIKDPASKRLDLTLLISDTPCIASGTFTKNKVQAAPVRLSKKHIKNGDVQAILANSGNANACTGEVGMKDAIDSCSIIADELGLKTSQIAVCSTGVIGLPMPMMRIEPKLKLLSKKLSPKNGLDVAKAIMTSDTRHKESALSISCGKEKFKIGICAKGAGMIDPKMATMLCFITTDANIGKKLLDKTLKDTVELSFNRITIDGDMSTNDTVIALANGTSMKKEMQEGSATHKSFKEALGRLLLEMAKSLVKDGERVTKFVTINVTGAKSSKDAQKAAEAVANSSLVKCSWNGNDPNWGRIIHAIGYSGAFIHENRISISIAGIKACEKGLQSNFAMDRLRDKVSQDEFDIDIDLGINDGEYTVYSSDLSPEYVDFNRSEYAYWKQAKKDGLT